MVIRVQPAVSDPDAARALVSLLGRLPDGEPVPPAPDSGRLLDSLAALAGEAPDALPEVVLVHELIGPLPALELIREVATRFPAVGVVLVTRDTSPALYSAAMDAGARGVVALPLTYEELAARTGAAAAWATGVRRHLGLGGGSGSEPDAGDGLVVSVSGAKGGVGATLAAVQLALAAAASGNRTALVDLDLQSGDVAACLDVRFQRSVADLAGIRDISARVLADAVLPHESGVGLLLAPAEGERGEEVDDRAARAIIGALRARYDAVVVDCGTQLTAANAAAVETADRAVLVTTPDAVAVRAARRTVGLWERLRVRRAEDTVTLVNRASRHTEIQPPLIARIVGTPVARTVVPAHFKELQSALDAGRMQDLDARGAVRRALWSLAGELGLAAAGEATDGGRGRGGRSGRPGRGRRAHRGGKGGGPLTAPRGEGAAGGPPAAPGPLPGPASVPAPRGREPGPARHALPGPGAGPQARRAALPPARPSPAAPRRPEPAPPAASRRPDPAPPAGPPAAPRPGRGAGPARGPAVRSAYGVPGPPPGPGDGYGAAGAPWPGYGPPPGRTPGPPGHPADGAPGARDAEDGDGAEEAGRTGRWGDRGALSVEFAGMAPIVLTVLALVWQCVLIGYTFSLAGNAADEAARAATSAAAHGDPYGACREAATRHLPARWAEGAAVRCRPAGGVWKADVGLRTPVLVPGAATLPFTVDGSAGAAREG